MTKSAHLFWPVKTTHVTEDYAKLYIQEVVRLHGVLVSIISDRGPYRIAKRIDNVAYELELPQELAVVHPVFHSPMLNKCMGDPSLIVQTEDIEIKGSLFYEEIPVQILDLQVRKLRTKR
ncbi:hypothetical protein MTR67_012792 [Solanum verrucosum]|uniref:Tf2-1-like SH3-like domain-containing protein n=1 Tax=Solanum verrucosum TaxID=315347 RepID=A0AAF0Q9C6_SOLVR|nr:hypothetical protein MTR67_012792 [Solanum verrucosum]